MNAWWSGAIWKTALPSTLVAWLGGITSITLAKSNRHCSGEPTVGNENGGRHAGFRGLCVPLNAPGPNWLILAGSELPDVRSRPNCGRYAVLEISRSDAFRLNWSR